MPVVATTNSSVFTVELFVFTCFGLIGQLRKATALGFGMAAGAGLKEKGCASGCKSLRRLDEMPLVHLGTGAGREEVMIKGGG